MPMVTNISIIILCVTVILVLADGIRQRKRIDTMEYEIASMRDEITDQGIRLRVLRNGTTETLKIHKPAMRKETAEELHKIADDARSQVRVEHVGTTNTGSDALSEMRGEPIKTVTSNWRTAKFGNRHGY